MGLQGVVGGDGVALPSVQNVAVPIDDRLGRDLDPSLVGVTDLLLGQLDEPLGLDHDKVLDTINDGNDEVLRFSISTVFGRFYIKTSYKYLKLRITTKDLYLNS